MSYILIFKEQGDESVRESPYQMLHYSIQRFVRAADRCHRDKCPTDRCRALQK